MNCAPRQTLLLCVAALTANAAAFEFELFPADSFRGIFSGNGFALLEKGAPDKINVNDAEDPEKKSSAPLKQKLHSATEKLRNGDAPGAEAVLLALAADEKNPDCFKSRLWLGHLAFFKQHWFASYNWFSAADKAGASSEVRLQSRAGAIHSLINGRAFDEAESLLESARQEFPEQQQLWRKLFIASAGQRGNTAELEKVWTLWKREFPPEPDEILYTSFISAGDTGAAENALSAAEKFYAAAFEFSVNDIHRRNCFRKLIPVQEKINADRALRSIDKYLHFFPKAEDAGMIRLRKGMILNRKKDFSGALKVFRDVLNNQNYKTPERVKAALYAAFACEKMGDISMARELYNSAIRRFGHQPEFAAQIKMQLLEFLVRTKEFSSAAVLGEELATSAEVEADKLHLLRLKALRELKRYAEATEIAMTLSLSPDPQHSAEGAWQFAQLAELQEEFSKARQLYLRFIERFPRESRVPEAMLAAADFALQQRNFEAASRELQKFLELYPRHISSCKALLGALYAQLQLPSAGDEKAGALFARMKKEFAGTTEYDQAVMVLCRTYVKKNNYTRALKLLEEFLKERSASVYIPEALLLAANVFERISNHGKAVEYVDRILDKYPNSPLAVDAAMLGGSSSFQSENYKKALAYYERARELGGRGVVAQVAAGEAADCHLQLRSIEHINEAIKIYRVLAENSAFPALQAQALYKLGSALEQINKNTEALKAYEELLALAAGSDKMRSSAGVASWCALSARSALRIILGTPHLPDGSQRAQRIYRLYSLLELPGSAAELRSYLEEIRTHYNLLD